MLAEVLAAGGKAAGVGLADGGAPVDTYDLIKGKKTLRGSPGENHSMLAEVLMELKQGNLATSFYEVPFDLLPEA